MLIKIIIFACIYLSASTAFAGQARNAIIAKQMDCVAKNAQDIRWTDVCSMGAREEALNVVNAQLDDIEQKSTSNQNTKSIPDEPTWEMPQDTGSFNDSQSAIAPDPAPQLKRRAVRSTYTNFEEVPDNLKQKLDPRRNHTFSFDWEPYIYKYEEPVFPIYNRGVMMGYTGKYAYRPSDSNPLSNLFFNAYMLEAFYAFGKLDYTGSGSVKDKKNFNYEVRGLIGKDYLLKDDILVTPYVGFGYRHLLDEGNGRLSTEGYYGYDRHSTYYYAPLGVTFMVPQGPWQGSANVEYDVFIQGEQVSDFSAGKEFTGFDNPNVHNFQTSGFGARASLKLLYAGTKLNFFVEPFVRYWNISDSDVTTATVDGDIGNFIEPKNITTEIGSKFGVQF